MFTKQPIICCVCGINFYTDFSSYGGFVCSQNCRNEWNWRKTLYISGNEYYSKKNQQEKKYVN